MLDPAARRLFRDGEPVAITARVFDVLEVLVRHVGQVVEKDVLLDRVWGDVAVEEGNLTRNVSTLRKVLGETPDEHRFVVTLPGRGYQFVATVDQLVAESPVEAVAESGAIRAPQSGGEEPAARDGRSSSRRVWWMLGPVAALAVVVTGTWALTRPWTVDRPRTPRVAVLPFKNLGADADEFVAAGITEEVTGRLAAVRDLHVISRTTATGYDRAGRTVRELARDLDVDHVLEGSVAWDTNRRPARVRITAQLVRASDDTHLWAESFDRSAAALFEVQTEIATRVVREMRARLMADERAQLEARPTAHLEAYREYLLGLFHAGRPDVSEPAMARTIEAFERAVDLDPAFAAAHARLARAHANYVRFGYDLSAGRVALIRRSVERAESLAGDAADTKLARAAQLSAINAPDEALVSLDAAARVRPSEAVTAMTRAGLLTRIGEWEKGYASARHALEIDPRHAQYLAETGLLSLALRRYAEASHHIERSIAIEPDQLLAYVLQVWCAWLWKADLREARAILDRLPSDDWRYAELRFLQGLYERRFDVARAGLEPVAGTWMRGALLARPVVLLEAQARRLEGDSTGARQAFGEAARLLAAEAGDAPPDIRLRGSLAVALAGLGRAGDARHEAGRALELMRWPDALESTVVREDVALAYTMIGDYDAALGQLERLVTRPAHFSAQVLRLDPRWEPLRAHPVYRRLTQ